MRTTAMLLLSVFATLPATAQIASYDARRGYAGGGAAPPTQGHHPQPG